MIRVCTEGVKKSTFRRRCGRHAAWECVDSFHLAGLAIFALLNARDRCSSRDSASSLLEHAAGGKGRRAAGELVPLGWV